jgi:ABC-type glycerol-3-phosphate transport system substrate-binding protein
MKLRVWLAGWGAAALLAGCAGDIPKITQASPGTPTVATPVPTIVAFMTNLVANETKETNDPISVDGLFVGGTEDINAFAALFEE